MVVFYRDVELGFQDEPKTQVRTQDKVQETILAFCVHPHSKAEIATHCGYQNTKSFTKRYLKPLMDAGLLAMTIPDKPNSRNQKYRLCAGAVRLPFSLPESAVIALFLLYKIRFYGVIALFLRLFTHRYGKITPYCGRITHGNEVVNMNFPGQDKEDLATIKRLLKEYRTLKVQQIYAWFPEKDRRVVGNMLAFLRRSGQLVLDDTGEFAALNPPEFKKGRDDRRIAAFWVLLRFAGRIEYHACGEYPAQVFFFSDGKEYEIVYVPYGNETMVNAVFARREPDDTRFLVVVESPEQIEAIDIPQAEWFCTVSSDGVIERYLQEELE